MTATTPGWLEWIDQLKAHQAAEWLAIRVTESITVGDALLSFSVVLFAFVFRHLVSKLLFGYLRRLAKRTETDYDDMLVESLRSAFSLFFLFGGIFLAIAILPIPDDARTFFSNAFRVVTFLLIFYAVLRVLEVGADVLADISKRNESPFSAFIPVLRKAVRLFLLLIGGVMFLDTLGYSVGSLLAAVGIGGAAFAFAARDTLANYYSFFAIALDRPFKIGDKVSLYKEADGVVEEIGLRSTRVREKSGTVKVIPNSVLARKTLANHSMTTGESMLHDVEVGTEATVRDLQWLLGQFKQVLETDSAIDPATVNVSLKGFGKDNAFLRATYAFNGNSQEKFSRVRERIDFKLLGLLERRGLRRAPANPGETETSTTAASPATRNTASGGRYR